MLLWSRPMPSGLRHRMRNSPISCTRPRAIVRLPRATSPLMSLTATRVRRSNMTFRPAAVIDNLVRGESFSLVGRALRAFMELLVAVCIGLAAFAWRAYGDTAEKKIAKWVTQFVLTASPPEKPASVAQTAAPAVHAADAANATPPQPAAPASSTAEATAPAAAASSAGSPQLLQSMARDIASLGREVEQLKAGVEQLKAGQQQVSREVAKSLRGQGFRGQGLPSRDRGPGYRRFRRGRPRCVRTGRSRHLPPASRRGSSAPATCALRAAANRAASAAHGCDLKRPGIIIGASASDARALALTAPDVRCRPCGLRHRGDGRSPRVLARPCASTLAWRHAGREAIRPASRAAPAYPSGSIVR